MASAFADIAFTPSVKTAQRRYGSRESNQRFETVGKSGNEIDEFAIKFIAARDSFYQATVSESGWPYIQHRGGPKGFLKVLDPRTLGYADFRGNRQYLSIGNLAANNKISLILMDYPRRQRLKIWGRARIVHENDQPDLMTRLALPAYTAAVKRGIIISVEALDWNCPQHITPRYTVNEVEKLIAPSLEKSSTVG